MKRKKRKRTDEGAMRSKKLPQFLMFLPLGGPEDDFFDVKCGDLLFKKCASHCSEKHMFTKSCEHSVNKLQKSPRKPQMASMMHTRVGFVGLKWAHKQEIHTFPTFCKFQGGLK